MSLLSKNELTEAWNELVSRFGRQAINSTCSWNAPHQQIRKLWLLQTQWIPLFLGIRIPEPFLSTLKNMGVKFLQGVENFEQSEVLFVQAAYNFLHAAKMHFMQL